MKRKALFIATIILCLALVTSGTLAYYTVKETAHNVITSGGVDISIVEKTINADGKLEDFPRDGFSGILPGMDVSKIVTVANTGPAQVWIRVKVEKTIVGADKEQLPLMKEVGDKKIPMLTFDTEEKWYAQGGYYYYTAPVDPGQSTGPLFESVAFAPEMDNAYQGCTATVTVHAQAVQTANNPIPTGGNVTNVQGWPAD